MDDVLMPPVGLLLGGMDFSNFFIVLRQGAKPGPYSHLADAKAAGAVSINYGLFINSIISFVIVAFAVFLLVQTINRLRREEKTLPTPSTKECPYCLSATRSRPRAVPTVHPNWHQRRNKKGKLVKK